MYTEDVRFERIESEYMALRQAQNKVLSGFDRFSTAFEQLSEQVEENRKAIEENRQAIQENRQAILENRKAILENRKAIEKNSEAIQTLVKEMANVKEMLLAIIEHQNVPYRPAMGFVSAAPAESSE